jgi:signal transduction histidine kinase
MSGEVEGALYRIAQEALTNVARHSAATEVQVALDYDEDEVCLTIKDNGRGFEMNPANEASNGHKTFGLSTMQERARLIGGWVIIQTSPGEGCRIRAIVSYTKVHEPMRSEI